MRKEYFDLMRYYSLLICFLLLLSGGVLYAQETAEVVDDWSPPQLTAVTIISSNSNTAYAKVGDTVWVYFTADEPIDPSTVNVKILGQAAALYRNKDNQTLSNYIVMDNNGAEGLIGFSISKYLILLEMKEIPLVLSQTGVPLRLIEQHQKSTSAL